MNLLNAHIAMTVVGVAKNGRAIQRNVIANAIRLAIPIPAQPLKRL